MSNHPEIDPKVITAAAEAGATAARSRLAPSGSTVMCMRPDSLREVYNKDQPAREAFARAAIEVYLEKMEEAGIRMRIINHGYEKQIKEAEDRIEALTQEISKLKKDHPRIELLIAELAHAKENEKKYQDAITDLKGELDVCRSTSIIVTHERDRLKKENGALAMRVVGSEHCLKTMMEVPADTPGVSSKMDQLTQELEQALGERMRLLKENQEFILKQENLTRECCTLKANADARQEALKEAKQAYQNTVNDRAKVIADLNMLQKKADKVLEERNRLLKENQELTLKQDALNGHLEASRKQVTKLLTELSLQKAGWIKFSDRRPTIDDADRDGYVCCMSVEGDMFMHKWHTAAALDEAMWRPTNSPVPASPFEKWKRSLTSTTLKWMGSPEDSALRKIWDSIEKSGLMPKED